jgi:hypothetical protein
MNVVAGTEKSDEEMERARWQVKEVLAAKTIFFIYTEK